MDFDELVDGVLQEGGFDVSRGVAGGWLNEMQKTAVADSEWLKTKLQLATTSPGQAEYDIPGNVAQIMDLYLAGASGAPGDWQRVSTTQMWEIQGGRQALRGMGGVFAPTFGSVGEQRIELYPAPVEGGVPIVALVALIPPSMDSGNVPVIPEDMHGDLKDGAIALGLLRIDERADSAASYEAKFQRMKQNLAKRAVKRVSGGASRMRVAGYDW